MEAHTLKKRLQHRHVDGLDIEVGDGKRHRRIAGELHQLARNTRGFGMGGEADVTPYMLSRYFGLRSFTTLYAFTWTAYACAGAIGPVLMGRVFDLTGSYDALLVRLAIATTAVASLMLLMPAYGARPSVDPLVALKS